MKVISRKKVQHLLYHVVDGFHASHKGLVQLRDEKIISMQEFEKLVSQNIDQLHDRITEWRATEKTTCIFFAALFSLMSITSNVDDLVRTARRPSVRKPKTEKTK